jgi:hypothetical protein
MASPSKHTSPPQLQPLFNTTAMASMVWKERGAYEREASKQEGDRCRLPFSLLTPHVVASFLFVPCAAKGFQGLAGRVCVVSILGSTLSPHTHAHMSPVSILLSLLFLSLSSISLSHPVCSEPLRGAYLKKSCSSWLFWRGGF